MKLKLSIEHTFHCGHCGKTTWWSSLQAPLLHRGASVCVHSPRSVSICRTSCHMPPLFWPANTSLIKHKPKWKWTFQLDLLDWKRKDLEKKNRFSTWKLYDNKHRLNKQFLDALPLFKILTTLRIILWKPEPPCKPNNWFWKSILTVWVCIKCFFSIQEKVKKQLVSPLEAKIFLTQSANFTQLTKIQWMRDRWQEMTCSP